MLIFTIPMYFFISTYTRDVQIKLGPFCECKWSHGSDWTLPGDDYRTGVLQILKVRYACTPHLTGFLHKD